MPLWSTGVAPVVSGTDPTLAASHAALPAGTEGEWGYVSAIGELGPAYRYDSGIQDSKSGLWLPAHWWEADASPILVADGSGNPCSIDGTSDTEASLAAAGWTVSEDATNTITLASSAFELRSAGGNQGYCYFLFTPSTTATRFGLVWQVQPVTGTAANSLYGYIAEGGVSELVALLMGVNTCGYCRMGTTSASAAKGLLDIGTAGYTWVFAEFDFSFAQGACRAWAADADTGDQTVCESQNGEAYGSDEIVAAFARWVGGTNGELNLKQFRAYELPT